MNSPAGASPGDGDAELGDAPLGAPASCMGGSGTRQPRTHGRGPRAVTLLAGLQRFSNNPKKDNAKFEKLGGDALYSIFIFG